jgi:pilus assembly protein TadC
MTAVLLLVAGGLWLVLPSRRMRRARARLAALGDGRRRRRTFRRRSGPSGLLRGLRRPRRRPRAAEDPRLPLSAELLAACLAAGASPMAAADAVGGSLDGPLGEGLRRAASELRLGGEPSAVWGRLGELPGAAALARQLELADTTGIPAVDAVTHAAAERRSRRVRQAQARIRRAAVYITGPLGLCFLPAFLLLGVAPVVIGLAQSLL